MVGKQQDGAVKSPPFCDLCSRPAVPWLSLRPEMRSPSGISVPPLKRSGRRRRGEGTRRVGGAAAAAALDPHDLGGLDDGVPPLDGLPSGGLVVEAAVVPVRVPVLGAEELPAPAPETRQTHLPPATGAPVHRPPRRGGSAAGARRHGGATAGGLCVAADGGL